jgi:GNAT superfamily N-acetyltransferase
MDAARYSAQDVLRDGTPVEIRALRPSDREGMQRALGRMSMDSIVRRFFSPRAGFSEAEVTRFVEVDFSGHVALVAVIAGHIVGGARYIVLTPGRVEMACAVEDSFQGRGLGSVLLRHLGGIAREAGIREVIADVMPGNQGMLRLLRSSGLPTTSERDPDAVHVTLSLGDAPVSAGSRP